MLVAALRGVRDRVIVTDPRGKVSWVNPAFERRVGLQAPQLLGRRVWELIDAATPAQHAHLLTTLARGEVFRGTFVGRTVDGAMFRESGSVSPVVEGEIPVGYVYASTDAVDLWRLKMKVERQESIDQLTGLANRGEFFVAATRAADRGASDRFAVILLELDRMASVADSLGYAVADRIVRCVARRLAVVGRAAGIVARVTDHGFAMLLDDAGPEEARLQAEQVIDALGPPIRIDGDRLYVHCRVGVACFPEHGLTADDLFAHASAAAHHSRGPTDTVVLFQPAMVKRTLAEVDVQEAFASGQFFLKYQPIVSLQGGADNFVEALARWRHPARGAVAPDEFLPVVDEAGLSGRFDRCALHRACNQAREWAARGLAVRVAVNISAQTFADPDIASWVSAAVRAQGLSPEMITIEITETTAMADPVAAAARVAQLRASGIHVAIDDFGIGHSSLGYLKNFEFNKLKIDRTFISGIGRSRRSEILVRSILSLARSLGLVTVAEGVETAEQREWLADAGCDYMQGWLVARALAVESAERFLRDGAAA